MSTVFRICFLLVYSLFWGGLTFYTGFVVRISHAVLDNPMEGGLITQQVTEVLQLLGGLAAILMVCNVVLVGCRHKKSGYILAMFTLVFSLALGGLVIVHWQLDRVIDVANAEVIDYDAFTIGHRRYNQLTTIEWLASVAYLAVSVSAWRAMDSASQANANIITTPAN